MTFYDNTENVSENMLKGHKFNLSQQFTLAIRTVVDSVYNLVGTLRKTLLSQFSDSDDSLMSCWYKITAVPRNNVPCNLLNVGQTNVIKRPYSKVQCSCSIKNNCE